MHGATYPAETSFDLPFGYLWSVAADPSDANPIVISAAPGTQQAHNPASAESAIYKTSRAQPWQKVREGLPRSRGTLASVMVSHKSEPGVFYAANNRGLFRSSDAGSTWDELPIAWPCDIGRANALIAVQE